MGFELIVDPAVSGELTSTEVMLWTTDRDPRLMDVHLFTTAAELRIWLTVMAGTYGAENIVVRWTTQLLELPAMAKLIAACLAREAPIPTEAVR